jgi:glycosyltransferase involved in cell wall biosynthesis
MVMPRKKKEVKDFISVIVPVYNSEKYLRRCIESIMDQTYEDLEIILVDDGSTDKSASICDEYANKDLRISVIHKENGGLSSARNAGLKAASGNLIGFVDSDDYIEPNMYEKLKENMDKYGSDIAVCSIYKSYKYMTDEMDGTDTETVYEGKDKFRNLENENEFLTVVAYNKLYKKEIFKKIKYPEGKSFEDSYVICDILNTAKKVSYLNEPLYYSTMRRTGLAKQNLTNHSEKIDSLDKYISYYKRHKYEDLRAKKDYKKVMETINYSYNMKVKNLEDERVVKYIDDAIKTSEKLKDNKYLSDSEKNNLNLLLQDKEKFYKSNKIKWNINNHRNRLISYK